MLPSFPMCIQRGKRSASLVALLLLAASAGCATTMTESADRTGVRTPSALEAALAADNGLEVRRWVVTEDPISAASALGGTGYDAIADEILRDRLERNGFRLRIIDEAVMDATLAQLGEPLTDIRTWHGQATQWRELSRRPVGPTIATLVDGRPRSFSGGAIRLLVRGWTVPMEDGLRLGVELVPHFDPIARGGYRALMGEDTRRGERFDPLAVELHLRAGQVLLVTSEPPTRRWESTTADARASDGQTGPIDDAISDPFDPTRSLDRVQSAAGVDFGPPAVVPITLGELLLAGELPPLRTVLLFIPRLPDLRLAEPSATTPSGRIAQRSREHRR